MDQLKSLDSIAIREKKAYEHLPSRLKVQPLFCLADLSEEENYYLFLEKDPAVSWKSLQTENEFTLDLHNRQGEQMFYFERQVSFFQNKLSVYDGTERFLGSIQRGLKLSKGPWQVLGPGDNLLYLLQEDPLQPDKVQIFQDKAVVGKIARRPTRFVEEGALKQDRFGIVFPLDADLNAKSILLGGLILIDLLYAD